ncbi:MAG: hypothetical protein KatS3mg097_010 [Candidatus Parcubacteria bacterium]|nr:MAG: hypothetical protein KatS3mg097_010 [Candidatus Parcubacteria bacterium]
MKKRKKIQFEIILQPESEGGFTVIVPELPGCVTYGENLEEALIMAKDAIKGYLHSLKKHKEPILKKARPLITSLEIEYA